jgi:hypothetical protein
MSLTVDKIVHLSADRAARLAQLTQQCGATEDALVEKALDLLFTLSEDEEEHRGWSTLAMKSLERVWDNDADAVYDKLEGIVWRFREVRCC